MVIWNVLPNFGKLSEENSGNPGKASDEVEFSICKVESADIKSGERGVVKFWHIFGMFFSLEKSAAKSGPAIDISERNAKPLYIFTAAENISSCS
jgi:hypothetical protein